MIYEFYKIVNIQISVMVIEYLHMLIHVSIHQGLNENKNIRNLKKFQPNCSQFQSGYKHVATDFMTKHIRKHVVDTRDQNNYKDKQLQNLRDPCRLSIWECKSDTGDVYDQSAIQCGQRSEHRKFAVMNG